MGVSRESRPSLDLTGPASLILVPRFNPDWDLVRRSTSRPCSGPAQPPLFNIVTRGVQPNEKLGVLSIRLAELLRGFAGGGLRGSSGLLSRVMMRAITIEMVMQTMYKSDRSAHGERHGQ